MNTIEKRTGMPKPDVSKFKNELSEFEKGIAAYDSGDLGLKEYKPMAGYFGSIPQKVGGHVVRLRLAGGVLTAEKLKFILNKAKEHNADFVHFTTCQTIQIHGLTGKQTVDTIRAATDVGIITLGTGGNNLRNVAASPLSGVDPSEVFDVLPFAEVTEDYILGITEKSLFPSKFKISFSNGADEDSDAVARDLGFVAVNDSFDVYAGGGMGNRGSRTGIRVLEGLNPNKVLYAVEAALSMFICHGEGESRAESRFRFLRDRLGEDGFRSEFLNEFELSENRGGLDLNESLSAGSKKGTGYAGGAMIQKDGKYSVKISPVLGDPSVKELEMFLKILEENPGCDMRMGTDQSAYFINLDKNIAENIVKKHPIKSAFGSSLSCIGYPLCQTGKRDSRSVLKKLLEMEESAGLPDGALPKIAISGCGSSCTCHQLHIIGLKGTSVKTDEGNVPGFEVHIGGSSVPGEERMGKVVGNVPETSLPELFKTIGLEASEKGFESWNKTEPGRLEEIIKSFATDE
jgi:ferredoxin-nitrite reductase